MSQLSISRHAISYNDNQVPTYEGSMNPKVSIVILTFNRGPLVKDLVQSIVEIDYSPLEIIVVDNCSSVPANEYLASFGSAITLIVTESNLGATGRNVGMAAASGEVVITLDDDIYGLDGDGIRHILNAMADPVVGAVCFKVLDVKGQITNWCHHYNKDRYAEMVFITNEITEGAAAFKRAVLEITGLYPSSFFISHEGPDLAYRIMNEGYNVIYYPLVSVQHHHAEEGRANWRRYYYDTRNLLWLSARNYSLKYMVKWVPIGIGAMLIYAVRDGYLKYWTRGVFDGVMGLKQALHERKPPTKRTLAIIQEIERHRQGFWKTVRQRIFNKGVRI